MMQEAEKKQAPMQRIADRAASWLVPVALMIAAVIALFKMYLERNMKDRLYYLGEYLWDVFRCGRWKLYFAGEREGAGAGICMAGPVFCSALMYMGGMY